MRTRLAVLAAILLCSVAAPAPASAATVRGVIHRVEGAIFAAHVREAAREWKQLPQAELACADQVLRERGQSVEELARRGVSPSNPRLANLRKQCSAATAAPGAGENPNTGRQPSDALG
jgi:hypothetical protein